MKLLDLLQKHPWEEIQSALVRLYPDHESELEGYQKVYKKLQTLTATRSDQLLHLELVYSKHTGEYQLEIKHLSPTPAPTDTGPLLSLEFTPWAKWLGMELTPKTLEKFSEYDILAHCLYEMTFFGFTQEAIQTTTKELNSRLPGN
ncbi:MAG: hypothetical protein H6636_13925 [Anaerolineales bacterium]|nr:hypothetical protein [Anaerolineales bacterium]